MRPARHPSTPPKRSRGNRWARIVCVLLLAGGASVAFPGMAQAVTGAWRPGLELPGTAGLNGGGNAQVIAVSCASAGNCSAVGRYVDASGHQQAFLADQISGTWGSARQVPGTAVLTGGEVSAVPSSVTCSPTFSCSVGGQYQDTAAKVHAFVANRSGGTWRTARELPGSAALDVGGNAGVAALSCPSGGSCVAVGWYTDSTATRQGLIATKVKGSWQPAIPMPGAAALNASGEVLPLAVDCFSAGNCAAGGEYRDQSGTFQAFLADEVNGTWLDAVEVPGTAALNTGGPAQVNSVSCWSAGNCSAVGSYTDGSPAQQVFVVDEVAGIWQDAQEIPGISALDVGGSASVAAVSCSSNGTCSAGGSYIDTGQMSHAFVVDRVSGVWGTASQPPGSSTVDTGNHGAVTSLSCPSAGFCGVVGVYQDAAGLTQAFVVNRLDGIWRPALQAPGSGKLNLGGNAALDSVSCPVAGRCSAGGFYTDGAGGVQAFVLTRS